ncbi:MAG: hypothetical protein KGO94_11975 [Alphaproteobacteria bacterium]|nr:hypothetical protein [Alphaproteobacteria bacterium]
MKASPELENFIDNSIELCRAKKYSPIAFIRMRFELGTVHAISKLVTSGKFQSGFTRLIRLGLVDWTIEAAVEKFPAEFSKSDLECAKFRLKEARDLSI